MKKQKGTTTRQIHNKICTGKMELTQGDKITTSRRSLGQRKAFQESVKLYNNKTLTPRIFQYPNTGRDAIFKEAAQLL